MPMSGLGNEPAVVFGVSDFVAVCNQTLEYAYPSVTIVGELANLRVSKNRWVYFDLKDEYASVKFFGTVQQLPGPLQDGMMVEVRGLPRLHNLYGFSVTVQYVRPVGEGSLKKAAELLAARLNAEGLFDPLRKRALPYPPQRIGLITSAESAAYKDFIKILNARWGGVEVLLADVQVQGEPAITQIVDAVQYFNSHGDGIDVLVITRGGGSADDLAAFSTEQVTRAVAGSRIPTLVAVGHEVDTSLAELAADRRASTPSNAAELLVPDRNETYRQLAAAKVGLMQRAQAMIGESRAAHIAALEQIALQCAQTLRVARDRVTLQKQLLVSLDPRAVLRRGYALVRAQNGHVIRAANELQHGQTIRLQLSDGIAVAVVQEIEVE